METRYTEAELVSFLEYVSNKGLLNRNTAQGRRVATLKVLQALDEHEKVDLRNIDRDATFNRFVNRFGKDFNPGSLQVYRSRFNSAIDDFLRYQSDPAAFKPMSAMRQSKGREKQAAAKSDQQETKRQENKSEHHISPPSVNTHTVVFPIPLRSGLTVQIHNLPADLTRAEAARIAGVVNALAIQEMPTS